MASTSEENDRVLVEERSSVRILALNRPKQLNALSNAMVFSLSLPATVISELEVLKSNLWELFGTNSCDSIGEGNCHCQEFTQSGYEDFFSRKTETRRKNPNILVRPNVGIVKPKLTYDFTAEKDLEKCKQGCGGKKTKPRFNNHSCLMYKFPSLVV